MAGLDIDTTKLQLKLRAIAKHTEALAEELAEIDKEVCPECGSADVHIVNAYGDTPIPVDSLIICNECARKETNG